MVIKLKEVRLLHNMTMMDLSKLSGVSKAHISYIEQGRKVPTIDVLCKLAKALNVDSDDLYDCESDLNR
jgi:transcriptional regulator with XRE-family HTH domain